MATAMAMVTGASIFLFGTDYSFALFSALRL
jgi:hypothetical protein